MGGRLDALVQNVAKEKLLEARAKIRMSSDNNALKMERMEMETINKQHEMELKKAKRAFALLESQNETLQ